MNKVYTRINWENYPSENTAVNESNLNKMDSALNEIDTRVVEHETTKANVALLNNLIDDWHIDETTGVITIHKVSGEQIIFDLNIEKVPVGFSMTEDGILVMTTDDGTEFTANIGSMIPVLTFNDSDQIAVAVSGEGVNKSYTFTIKTGSITADKLQPNFLADVTLQAGNAEISARAANQYAQKAKEYADEAKGSAELANTDGIVSIMNQATTTWVMPDYMQDRDTQPYVCGIGTPEENGYSADDYNDETGYGEPYLDVRSGMVYEAIRINDAPLTYGWVEKEQLESIQYGVGLKDVTYTLLNNDTHDWKIYFPTMVVSNGIAHLSFRLQAGKSASYTTNAWTQALQLSVRPKSNVYGVTNTYHPKTERFSAYIDANGILYITPNTSYTGTIVTEIMFIFVVNE